jgi:hypothetical protein
MRVVLWTVAGVAAAVAVALVVVLWRRRKADPAGWKVQDYLAAIGIAVALFAGVLTAIAAQHGQPGEPADVSAYRQNVRATCVSLKANTVPIFSLPDEHGNIHRQDLIDALHGTIDASLGILGQLWDGPAPERLGAAAADAEQKGNVWLYVAREQVNAMAGELPEPTSLDDALRRLQRLDQQNNPNVSAFLGAMSVLAGQTCAQ